MSEVKMGKVILYLFNSINKANNLFSLISFILYTLQHSYNYLEQGQKFTKSVISRFYINVNFSRLNTSQLASILKELNPKNNQNVKMKHGNWTVVQFDSIAEAAYCADRSFKIEQKEVYAHHVHWTTGK